MNPENALMSRTITSIDKDTVEIVEKWDLDNPDCPFVSSPWSGITLPEGLYLRHTTQAHVESVKGY